MKIEELQNKIIELTDLYESGIVELEKYIQENYYCDSISEFINELEKLKEDPNTEELSFESIYKYKDKLYWFIFNIVKNHSDTEEILQDTFIKANRALPLFKKHCSLSTWLFTIAKNASYNKYGYNSRRKQKDHFSIDEPVNNESDILYSDVIPDINYDMMEDIHISEYQSQINFNLNKLNESHRQVLELKVKNGMDYQEIADELNIKMGTVKSRLSRAREQLSFFIKQ